MNSTQSFLGLAHPLRVLSVIMAATLSGLSLRAEPPDDFPRFQVPDHTSEMTTLRELFWLHYPRTAPNATLWDEWLPDAALWPAVRTEDHADRLRQAWKQALTGRILDPEGYVATHQHASIAHQLGWPFPFWNQGRRGFGWHFSFKNTVDRNWRPHDLSKHDGWTLTGANDAGIKEDGWQIEITNAFAIITARPWLGHTFEVPFLQLRWNTTGLGAFQPYIEWTTPSATNFTTERRMYFDPVGGGPIHYTMIPMYRHPQWTGEVAQVRIGLGNPATGQVTIQAFFSQYDTRHNINGQDFVRGCAKYFWWTGDLTFLRANINRMRTAIRYLMTEHQALERKVVFTDWVGHDGRTGVKRTPDGKKEIITGQGIGNNYWDLMPFGWLDAYATIQYYDAVRTLARIEREILAHPEWNIPRGVLAFTPEFLEEHAAEVKRVGNEMFWNQATGRFYASIDAAGEAHDYGYTFLNCEAIYYDFATPEHAQSIMSWLNGDRLVADDTSQGTDIYHWRFGPRATTRRNIDWYFWAWNDPESIPWGGQVQDGGAVLGFAYHDLMARLQVLGPDNAWTRLRETLKWFDEVQAVGGYRKYYDGKREGTLQGGGTAGGLGLDHEFFESALVPQIMLYGFLGFAPRGDGFKLDPRLPASWPELRVDQICFHDFTLRIRAARHLVEIQKSGPAVKPMFLQLPAGNWKATWLGADGNALRPASLPVRQWDGAYQVNWSEAAGLRFEVSGAKLRQP